MVKQGRGYKQIKKSALFIALIFLGFTVFVNQADVLAEEQAKETKSEKNKYSKDKFMTLGTEEGIGGKDFMRFDRNQIKHQIKTFIPPILRPGFTGHAYVMPPGLFAASIRHRFTELYSDDWFMDHEVNSAVFKDRKVSRHLTDFDLFYGFDLNRKYLHGFTARLNIPYLDSKASGPVHPGGVQTTSVFNVGSTQAIGDVGLFLKKKIKDQGTFPVGIAVAGAVFFPTGSNDEKFGSDGLVIRTMDTVTDTLIFPRFAADGRMPSTLQPGTGRLSYLLGGFMTRQFNHGNFAFLGGYPGRSALHIGVTHKFVFEEDGIDYGDKTTFFTSFVKPFYKDYLAWDLTFVGFAKEKDSYAGRPDFSGGITGMFAPSLIFSPNPFIRFTTSYIKRVFAPELGPAPPWVANLNVGIIF